ncbi:Bem46 protein [Legionella busanensis]|uniref:Bem46 protein n=1 Tax=Legionella busanensis TaxID=190655 RepID=A0A378JH01_9GAMM|nr:Bem46 protein [Legionella busanensis]
MQINNLSLKINNGWQLTPLVEETMLKQTLIFLITFIIVALVSMYLLQRQFIYFPARLMPIRQFFAANDMAEIYLKTEDRLKLLSWYKPAEPGMPTIIYYHGNAGHIGYRMPFIRYFLNEGYGVLLVEYRGYGGNEGKINERGLYLDGQAAIKFLLEQGILLSKIILYGESLGTGVATKIGSQYKVCAVILQSPYTSLSALAKVHYPWLPIPVRDKFDSLKRIQEVTSPILILHGLQDNIVPYAQGLELYKKANEPKEFIDFEKRGHNDLWNMQFFGIINKFIHKHCLFRAS